MSAKRSHEKRFGWGHITTALAGASAFVAAAIVARMNAGDILHAKIAAAPMLASNDTNPSPDMHGLIRNAEQFVIDQAHRSLLLSAGVGMLALIGLGTAARFAHKHDRHRSHYEHEDDGLFFIDRDTSAGRDQRRAVHALSSAVLSQAARRYDDVADPAIYAIQEHGGPTHLGNGLYRSVHSADTRGALAYTGDGVIATDTVRALGPLTVDYRTSLGHYYLNDMPPPVALPGGYYRSTALTAAA